MVCIYRPTAFNPVDVPSRAVPLRLHNSLLTAAFASLLRPERPAARTSSSRMAVDRRLVIVGFPRPCASLAGTEWVSVLVLSPGSTFFF